MNIKHCFLLPTLLPVVCLSNPVPSNEDVRIIVSQQYDSGFSIEVKYQTINGIDVFNSRSKKGMWEDGSVAINYDKFKPVPEQVEIHPGADREAVIQALNLNFETTNEILDTTNLPTNFSLRETEIHELNKVENLFIKPVYFFDENNNCLPALRVQVTYKIQTFTHVLDARTYEILVSYNETIAHNHSHEDDNPIYFNVFPKSPAPSISHPDGIPNQWQAEMVDPVILYEVFDKEFSPLGWIHRHNADIVTQGNNVAAVHEGGISPDGDGPARMNKPGGFDWPSDFSILSENYINAVTVNTFWSANIWHNIHYRYGFTEEWGNFQHDNFNRGGVDKDSMGVLSIYSTRNTNNAFWSGTEIDGTPGTAIMLRMSYDEMEPDRHTSQEPIIALHEYTHGETNRLVGTLRNFQSASLNEGWSDFGALLILSEQHHFEDPNAVFNIGGWSLFKFAGFLDFEDNYYYGIRIFPISIDQDKNPITLNDTDIEEFDIPDDALRTPLPWSHFFAHSLGEIWAVTLWGIAFDMVERYGFEEGKFKMGQLVTEGKKFTNSEPSFIDARNGILLADEVLNHGTNRSLLWKGFASRGMGYTSTITPSISWPIMAHETYDTPDWGDYDQNGEKNIFDALMFYDDVNIGNLRADMDLDHRITMYDIILWNKYFND